MPRSSMMKLINFTRDLIGDSDQVFSDDLIERSLDVHRWDFRYVLLKPLESISGGSLEYRDWYSEFQFWEDDTRLYDGDYQEVTPSVSDPFHGRWSLSAPVSILLVSGKVYDPYAAAVDLLEMWAGRVAVEFDASLDGADMKRSQKQAALRALADLYRMKQRVVSIRQVRGDVY